MPDEVLAMGLDPFETIKVGANNVPVVYLGTNNGFMVKKDFAEWRKEFKAWLTKTYEETGGFEPVESSLVEWAVGMLWPDQSYVSIRMYRGPVTKGWSPFHQARFEMYVGESPPLYFLKPLGNYLLFVRPTANSLLPYPFNGGKPV